MQCRLCASNEACPDMLKVVLVYGDILFVHTWTRLRNEKCHINHGRGIISRDHGNGRNLRN